MDRRKIMDEREFEVQSKNFQNSEPRFEALVEEFFPRKFRSQRCSIPILKAAIPLQDEFQSL